MAVNTIPDLDDPLTTLSGVGPKLAEQLGEKGLKTLMDACFWLPSGYQDRTRVTAIRDARPDQQLLLTGQLGSHRIVPSSKPSALIHFKDETGSILIRLFHFSRKQLQTLSSGKRAAVFGTVRENYQHQLEMTHPEITLLKSSDSVPTSDALTPVYPAIQGISSSRFRKLMDSVIASSRESIQLQEEIPSDLLPQDCHLPLIEAIKLVHTPPPNMTIAELLSGEHPAIKRLAFEELLAHNLSMKQLRKAGKSHAAYAYSHALTLKKRFLSLLPFSPTTAQERATEAIRADLAQPAPMLRLLQGDVGTGKTLVAAIAMLDILAEGHQCALMAPTEILAEQHLETFKAWFDPMGIKVLLLTSRMKAIAKKACLDQLQQPGPVVVVGTHALVQDGVVFNQLGLVIIDEQHRFGVHQRLTLASHASEGYVPHQLIMTATPIPRTLAMTSYANLDYTLIDEYPAGRKPINTRLINLNQEDQLIARLGNQCADGAQVYWVCTLVEISEHLDAEAAEARFETLKKKLPGINIGLVHGRMAAKEKQAMMEGFHAGEISILVATTVIEVGVNVPNASIMVIENPERLGLAQLHQLRGRVGRGSIQSHCILLYDSPLSQNAKARLTCMRETQDGFVIAETDLQLRGPGEVMGSRQTGAAGFRIADLERDQSLLDDVAKVSEILDNQHPRLAKKLTERWVGNALLMANA